MKSQRVSAPRGEAARKWRAAALACALLLGRGAVVEIPASPERTAFEQGIPAAEVEFRNGTTTLRGTVFRPGAAGSGPGVVILGGSEREARTDYKRRVASKFAESGLSALIYDSPGTGASTGNALLQTKNDRIVEALAAALFLRGCPGVDPDRVGLWGISEGAGIALFAAARDPRVAFAIPVSSALGIAPMEISRFRIEMSGHEDLLSSEEIARALVLEEILYDLFSGAGLAEWRLIGMKVRNWPDEPWRELIEAVKACRRDAPAAAREKAKDLLIRSLESWKDTNWFPLAIPDIALFDRIAALDAGTFLAFLDNNPWAKGDWLDHLRARNDLSTLRCPVLAVWGEKDRFLPPHPSAAVLKRLLSGVGTDLTIEIIPGAGHTMTRAGENEVAPEYDKIVAAWLSSKIRPRPSGG
jgi:pimeloyl-ACP methyl ester carboxylesterase